MPLELIKRRRGGVIASRDLWQKFGAAPLNGPATKKGKNPRSSSCDMLPRGSLGRCGKLKADFWEEAATTQIDDVSLPLQAVLYEFVRVTRPAFARMQEQYAHRLLSHAHAFIASMVQHDQAVTPGARISRRRSAANTSSSWWNPLSRLRTNPRSRTMPGPFPEDRTISSSKSSLPQVP